MNVAAADLVLDSFDPKPLVEARAIGANVGADADHLVDLEIALVGPNLILLPF